MTIFYKISAGFTVLALVALAIHGTSGEASAAGVGPIAKKDQFTGVAGTPLSPASGFLFNDYDNDDDYSALSVNNVFGYDPGSLIWDANGFFTYTPPAGFVGVKTFSYTITDGTTTSNETTVTMTFFSPEAFIPSAGAPDAYTTLVDVPLVVAAPGVLANDGIANAEMNGVSTHDGADLVYNPDGSFTWTPALGFVGLSHFEYQVWNGVVFSEFISVSITVSAPVEITDEPLQVAGTLATLEETDSLALTGPASTWLVWPAALLLMAGLAALIVARARRASAE